MKTSSSIQKSDCQMRILSVALLGCLCCLAVNSRAEASHTNTPAVLLEHVPETPRDFFNAGTRMLQAKQWREAEAYLETCLSRQDATIQPDALYNLGHTRFERGAELLEKAPDSGRTASRAQQAAWSGGAALRDVDSALESLEIRRMVQSYLHGRGTRRELNSAIKAIRQALETYGEVLNTLQRASSDFKSAAELNPADERARKNAEIVDRHIAKLIDQIRAMQQALAAAAQMQQQLGEKLKQLRGQIPDDAMPPGAPGEGEEEDDYPSGLEPGMAEGPGKTGKEQNMSREEVGRILDGFRLDGDRRLPMGGDEKGKPENRSGKTW